jgi:hypothetical protein
MRRDNLRRKIVIFQARCANESHNSSNLRHYVHKTRRFNAKSTAHILRASRTKSSSKQLALIPRPVAPELLERAAQNSERSTKGRGAIFTKKEVVEFILDLVGYTSRSHVYLLHSQASQCVNERFQPFALYTEGCPRK